MKFSNLSNQNVKIKLAPGASLFSVEEKFFFIKHDNRLFKINISSDDKRLRIFQILKEPRKLVDIVHLLSEFRKKDVINFLEKLYSLNLIIFETIDEQGIGSNLGPNKVNVSRYYSKDRGNRKPSSSRILLIGRGALANRIFAYLNNSGIKCNKIPFSELIYEPRKKTKDRIDDTVLSTPSLFTSSIKQYDLIIAAEDYHNISFFETVNKISIKKKIPWIRASFDDNYGYLGPFVIPGQTSCYNCCELRLVANSPDYEYFLWKYKEYIPKTKPYPLKIFIDILSAMCASEVARYFMGKKPQSIDNLFLFDTREMNLSKHKIISHPSCIYCTYSKEKSRHQKLLWNKRTRIGVTRQIQNTNPKLSYDELLQRLNELEDKKTGIALNIEKRYESNIFGIDYHHFYIANGSLPLRIGMIKYNAGAKTEDNLLPLSSGSGFSPGEAKLHASMELVERYSNMVIDESRIIWTTYNNVRKRAVNPIELGVYGEEHYQRKEFMCSRFSPTSTIPWIEGQDLFSGKSVLICADFVHYTAIREKPLIIETSNGAASHTNYVQAILNGLYEVIERDAFLIMWLKRLSMPILEVKRLPFGFEESIKRFNEHGMKVKLVNLTNDTYVPTVMAVCYNKSDKYPSMLVGAGSHIEPEKALQKALFEMELLLINRVEDPTERKITGKNRESDPADNATFYVDSGRRRYWDFMISSKKKSELPKLPLETAYKSLSRIVKTLHNLNHRVIWVDITPPDIQRLDLKVVKVFVTGFQPLYFTNEARLSSRRLYEAPTRLGYNLQGERLHELNPAPHPLS